MSIPPSAWLCPRSSHQQSPFLSQGGRALASDVITHLVNRGHNDPKVAAFAQRTLQVLEHFVKTPTSPAVAYVKQWHASHDCFDRTLSLSDLQVQEGRKLLNQTLYACMNEANADVYIPMLAIYVLAAAQRDGREYVFSQYVISRPGNYHPILKDFKEPTRRLGAPSFLKPQEQAFFLELCPRPKKYRWRAEAVIDMIVDFRRCLTALAKDPLLTDTGLYKPIYRQRTYTDMQAQIANDLSQQENYIARVKTLTSEHTIRTNPLIPPMTEAQLTARIEAIKQHMREQGLCRPAHAVEAEVRQRHEQLRERNDPPPPSHTNRRRRPRPPTQS
jgi:hypothetical protein